MATAKFNKEKVKIFCQNTLSNIERERMDSYIKSVYLYITKKEQQKKKSWFRFFVKVPTFSEAEEKLKKPECFGSGSVYMPSTYAFCMSKFWRAEELCKKLILMCTSTMDDCVVLNDEEVDLLNQWGNL